MTKKRTVDHPPSAWPFPSPRKQAAAAPSREPAQLLTEAEVEKVYAQVKGEAPNVLAQIDLLLGMIQLEFAKKNIGRDLSALAQEGTP